MLSKDRALEEARLHAQSSDDSYMASMARATGNIIPNIFDAFEKEDIKVDDWAVSSLIWAIDRLVANVPLAPLESYDKNPTEWLWDDGWDTPFDFRPGEIDPRTMHHRRYSHLHCKDMDVYTRKVYWDDRKRARLMLPDGSKWIYPIPYVEKDWAQICDALHIEDMVATPEKMPYEPNLTRPQVSVNWHETRTICAMHHLMTGERGVSPAIPRFTIDHCDGQIIHYSDEQPPILSIKVHYTNTDNSAILHTVSTVDVLHQLQGRSKAELQVVASKITVAMKRVIDAERDAFLVVGINDEGTEVALLPYRAFPKVMIGDIETNPHSMMKLVASSDMRPSYTGTSVLYEHQQEHVPSWYQPTVTEGMLKLSPNYKPYYEGVLQQYTEDMDA